MKHRTAGDGGKVAPAGVLQPGEIEQHPMASFEPVADQSPRNVAQLSTSSTAKNTCKPTLLPLAQRSQFYQKELHTYVKMQWQQRRGRRGQCRRGHDRVYDNCSIMLGTNRHCASTTCGRVGGLDPDPGLCEFSAAPTSRCESSAFSESDGTEAK
jgi:hypothetical protein